jgi:CO/xanthine dehydrogenase Mo-binding subunit
MRDSVARVTGSLPYGVNVRLPGMLAARVLRSPLPHARIVSINTDAAKAAAGVVAVLTAADFDGPDAPTLLYGFKDKDQPVVARERVRYVGEPVALVAAETLAEADEALALVEVEYEELPAVYSVADAMAPGAPTLHEAHPDNCFVHSKLRHGDLEAGFAAADEIVEETFDSPLAQQVSLEPHVTAVQWADGRLTVWTASQAPYMVRATLADIFHIPPEDVRVIVPPLGGGYGGKGHLRIEPMVAALAHKTGGRPVKLVLTRAEEFVTVTKHAVTIRIKTGFKRDGSLTARQVTLHWNGGAYGDASPLLIPAGMVRSVGPYRIPVVHVDSYGYYTNLPPAGAYRGAMSSQTTWAYESHMDSIARRLGIDPLEVRRRNLLKSGEQFATGETLHDVHFAECLERCAEAIDWDASKVDRGSGHIRRGRGMAVMMKSTVATSRSECRLVIDDQGQVDVYTSTVEMGQGAHTALAQIAAEATGVPLEAISIIGPDTAVTPFDSTTSASRATNMMGTAIQAGGTELKRKLIEAAAPLLETEADQLSAGDEAVFVAAHPEERISYDAILQRSEIAFLDAQGEHATKFGLDPETGQGIATPHWHQGAGACQVEVDTETGKVRVLRYAASSFAGRVVNPMLAKLQNDGNVIFGLGPTLLEEMIVDGGQVANSNLSDYMIPSILDVPDELHSVLIESDHGEFHGIGEMTLPPVAPAVANAIFDAVGVRIRDLPITAEKLLRAIREQADGQG